MYREIIDLYEEQLESYREGSNEEEKEEGFERKEKSHVPVGGKRSWSKTKARLERQSAQRFSRRLREEVEEKTKIEVKE